MILFGLNILMCLMLIFFQTTLKTTIPVFQGFYDVSIPFICYLSIHQHFGLNVIMVILLGWSMDSFSGGPFGLYLTSYFWYLCLINKISGLFNIANFFMMSILITVGVFFQNVLFYCCLAVTKSIPDTASDIMSLQMSFAITTGTFICMMFTIISNNITHWISRQIEDMRTQDNC